MASLVASILSTLERPRSNVAFQNASNKGYLNSQAVYDTSQVTSVEQLKVGETYILRYEDSPHGEEIILTDVNTRKKGWFSGIRTKEPFAGRETTNSLIDYGVIPAIRGDGTKAWNPSNWIQRKSEAK
jgi:hypothetical protein